MIKKTLLIVSLVAIAGCADVATTTTKSAPAQVRPDVISYCNLTFNSVPQGAAINVDGQFVGYSPVVIPIRLVNGRPVEPILIDAIPTAPGQFRQHGSIGFWDQSTYGPTETATA
jgi:hypothetical protein